MDSHLDPLYDKTVNCLVCDHSFQTKKVRSRFGQARNIEADFFTEYIHGRTDKNINPLLYYVNVCPSCGYSFSEEANSYFIPGAKDTIFDKITRNWQGQNYFCEKRTPKIGTDAYKLAIYSGNLKKERPIVMAGLHMRLSWIFRMLDKQEEEVKFKGYALEHYEKAYFDGDYKNSCMSSICLSYLIGELYRQFDNYPKAGQYFSKLIHVKQPMKDKRFVEMARDQWYEMAQANRKIKSIEKSIVKS